MRSLRGRREKGATLVEAALAFPILILIIISILERGVAFRDYLTVSCLPREAAGAGARAGNAPLADCAILHGIEDIASEQDLRRMEAIRIYRALPSGVENSGANTGP